MNKHYAHVLLFVPCDLLIRESADRKLTIFGEHDITNGIVELEKVLASLQITADNAHNDLKNKQVERKQFLNKIGQKKLKQKMFELALLESSVTEIGTLYGGQI